MKFIESLLGNVLPFIGYRVLDVTPQGFPLDEHPINELEADVMLIQWLGHYMTLWTRMPIRRKPSPYYAPDSSEPPAV